MKVSVSLELFKDFDGRSAGNTTDNSLDRSRVSVLGLQDRSTCSVTVTGVADGAGGSGVKSRNPMGTPNRPPFCMQSRFGWRER